MYVCGHYLTGAHLGVGKGNAHRRNTQNTLSQSIPGSSATQWATFAVKLCKVRCYEYEIAQTA